jgi:hypothetical protein
VRAQPHRVDLVPAFEGDPALDHVRTEDVAGEQEFVVGLQPVDHLLECGGDAHRDAPSRSS